LVGKRETVIDDCCFSKCVHLCVILISTIPPPPAESFSAVPDVELHVCLIFDLSIRSGAERRKQNSFRGGGGGHGQSFRRVAPEVGLPATRHLLPANPPPPASGAGIRGRSPPALS
jgi:hypothetical protein